MHILKSHTRVRETARSSESNERIYEFLRHHPIGVLATVDPDGNPHATVIYFSIDKSFNCSFVTKIETKKYDNILHNNHVNLVTYDAETQTTAQITARAVAITNKVQAAQVFIDVLKISSAMSEADIPPISKLEAGEYVALKLKPVQIRMAMFIRPDHGGYDMYETIDFTP